VISFYVGKFLLPDIWTLFVQFDWCCTPSIINFRGE
jgi:hypothetical protein